MLRSSALILLLASGCAVSEGERPTWGELACEGKVQGDLHTRTWCPGTEWRTWHAKDQAASAGFIVDGVHLPPHTMWWPDGRLASTVEGETLSMYDERGAQDQEPVGQTMVTDKARRVLPCPPNAGLLDTTADSGHALEVCGPGEEGPHGRKVSYYQDGSVESVQYYVHGKRHGPFEAYHPGGSAGAVGAVWIRGAFAADKKHGPWLTFGPDGTVTRTRWTRPGRTTAR